MKNLSPIWFLKSPIDVEHKHYILLDFLPSVSSEIRDKKIYSPVKRIFNIIKELITPPFICLCLPDQSRVPDDLCLCLTIRRNTG